MREEVLLANKDEMEEEIGVKCLASRKRKGQLQTAEKLLEYARSRGNEKLLLVLSKSTDLLQKMVLQNQKQASIHDFYGK